MTITLDDDLWRRLAEEAQRRGQNVDAMAEDWLRHQLNIVRPVAAAAHTVMEFAGVGAGRPGALTDRDAQNYIDELRDEWDERERAWRA